MINEVIKHFNRLRNRIYLMLARGIVKAIDNSEKTQKIQIECLADETISDIERLENYGMASYPLTESEAFIAFLNGNRNQGLVISVHDREYRPDYLLSGDVAIYDYQDKVTPHRIWLTAGGVIIIRGTTISITGITAVTGAFSATSVADASATTPTMAAMRALFNAHVHTSAAPGNPTSVPTTTM